MSEEGKQVKEQLDRIEAKLDQVLELFPEVSPEEREAPAAFSFERIHEEARRRRR